MPVNRDEENTYGFHVGKMEKFLDNSLRGGNNQSLDIGYSFLFKDFLATVALYMILFFLSYNLMVYVVIGFNAYFPYALNNQEDLFTW